MFALVVAGREAMSDEDWIEQAETIVNDRSATVAWWKDNFDMDMSGAFGGKSKL
jgi:hypothetical protein